jgi:hypothetical protein
VISLNSISNSRLIGGLARTFAMKISGSPAPTLAPEVSPGYEINNWSDPTTPFLQRARLQTASAPLTPVATQFAEYQLRNPVNSGVLVVVTDILVTLASVAGMSFATTDFTPIGTALEDFRWLRNGVGQQQGTAILSARSTAAPTNWTARLYLANVETKCRWVIPPGCALGMTSLSSVNNNWQLAWREIPVQAEELQNG